VEKVSSRDDSKTLPGKRADTRDTGARTLYGDVLSCGALAGEYTIQAAIASGGCGTVYRAQHRVLGRPAAVKVLHREMAESPEMLERFVREARAVNVIRHPNIVDIYEFGQLDDGRPYFVMELLEGASLQDALSEKGRLSPAEALEILEPLGAALAAAHHHGIVHRDLKASNVALVDAPDGRTVKLLDFGIAKLLEPEPGTTGLTSAGRRLGTPDAMAPEQILGLDIDARTDIYALGVLTYQLLTGRTPFSADDPAEIERLHLEAPAPRPSHAVPVPPAVDAIVLRCLEKKRDARFESVESFLAAFRSAIGGDRASTGPTAAACQAVAILVETRAAGPDAGDDLDDALLDDMSTMIEIAEEVLREGGFALVLQTATSVLGASAMTVEDPNVERDRRTAAVECALRLAEAIAARENANSRARAVISVHAGAAVVRLMPGGADIVGGAIMRIANWAASGDDEGVHATAAILDGLQEELRRRVHRREG
jgi:eukaryotic-like serine/threonine-protein kinase